MRQGGRERSGGKRGRNTSSSMPQPSNSVMLRTDKEGDA